MKEGDQTFTSVEYKPACEAPIHVDSCSGLGSTVDHFTPKCVAKIMGWSRKQVNDPSNLQRLSPQCHRKKDASTPRRADVLRMERRGVVLSFEQHRAMFSQFEPRTPVEEVEVIDVYNPSVTYSEDPRLKVD